MARLTYAACVSCAVRPVVRPVVRRARRVRRGPRRHQADPHEDHATSRLLQVGSGPPAGSGRWVRPERINVKIANRPNQVLSMTGAPSVFRDAVEPPSGTSWQRIRLPKLAERHGERLCRQTP
eukprot:6218368-Prymnesium_polylepis.1